MLTNKSKDRSDRLQSWLRDLTSSSSDTLVMTSSGCVELDLSEEKPIRARRKSASRKSFFHADDRTFFFSHHFLLTSWVYKFPAGGKISFYLLFFKCSINIVGSNRRWQPIGENVIEYKVDGILVLDGIFWMANQLNDRSFRKVSIDWVGMEWALNRSRWSWWKDRKVKVELARLPAGPIGRKGSRKKNSNNNNNNKRIERKTWRGRIRK